jgi:hypothetical protein
LTGIAQLWLADYGRAALILATALCLGYPIGRRFLHGPAAAPIMLLTGLAGLSLVVCLLSWAGVFTRAAMIAVATAAVLIAAGCLRSDLPRWRRRWLGARPVPQVVMGLTTVGIVVLGFSWFALFPVTANDAVAYHLPLARDLVAQHGFRYDPFVRYSFFPQANEALFAVMLMLSTNATSSGALEFSVLGVAVVMLPLWFAGSGRSIAAGLVAGLVVLASPVVIWAGTVPFVDTWTMSFVLAGTLVGLDAAEGRIHDVAGFALMGALIGEAAASKYTGAVYGACGVLTVLLAGGRARLRGPALLAALGGAAALVVPWYGWTVHTTGDPLYPFATGLFGNRRGLWTPAELRAQVVSARGITKSGIDAIVHRDVQYLGGEVLYNTGPNRSPLSWWLGSGFLGLLARAARRDRTFVAVALAGVVSIAFSVGTSADPRYLVPAVGLLALLAGLAVDLALMPLLGHLPRWLRDIRLAPIWCAAAAAAILWTSISFVRWSDISAHGLPTGPAAVEQFLSYQIPCYAAVAYLNSHAGSRYRAWAYSCEQARYYARGRLIGDAFSAGARDRIFNDGGGTLPSKRTLWARLQPLRVGWIILSPTPGSPRKTLGTHGLFTYVTTAGPDYIFKVAPAPSSRYG